MKKIFISLLFIAVASAVADAKQRTTTEMKSVAMDAISHLGSLRQGARSLGDLKVLKSDTQLSVIGFENGGFAVIANDDTFSPVLGYSASGISDNHSPAFLWWMEMMNKSLEQMIAEGKTTVSVARTASARAAVSPITTTKWGQSAPFNDQCPEYESGGVTSRYVTGCVATAMAQVMYCHKYPVTGTGSTSYRFTPEGKGALTLRANFGTTTYDWDNMLTDYSGSYTTAQATAVSTLMSHCGIAVQMQYNQSGSGAQSNMACKALKRYFGYSTNIGCLYREFFNDEEWMQIIYNELNDGCPIIYGGVTTRGAGHSFVLDGYDEDGLVHVNWGWNGLDDGYFEVASMNAYSEYQDMVMVREPDDARFTERYQSLWGLQQSFSITRNGNNLTLNDVVLVSFATPVPDADDLFGSTDFSGKVDFVATNLVSGETTSLVTVVNNGDQYSYGNGVTATGVRASIASLPDGEYRLYFASMADTETEWTVVRSKEGVRNSYLLTISGSNITLTAEASSAWTGIEEVDIVPVNGNNRVYTIDGRYVGDNLDVLPNGIYVVNGKKIIM